jgi:hypothetical protein
MADWATIASVGTAAGTMVLGLATFASVRSANRAARTAERSLQVGLRPVLMPSRPQDPEERISWADGHRTTLAPGAAYVGVQDGVVYLAMALRNAGAGLAVLRRWRLDVGRPNLPIQDHADPSSFRPLRRDIYIPANDTGFWQGVIRDPEDPLRAEVAAAIDDDIPLTVEILYGDHEGGQPTISLFAMQREDGGEGLIASVGRHWLLDPQDERFLQR